MSIGGYNLNLSYYKVIECKTAGRGINNLFKDMEMQKIESDFPDCG